MYHFAATPAEIPADSAFARQHVHHPTPQTPEKIRGMGSPVLRDSSGTKPGTNDIVIRGYLLSLDEGDATKCVAFGFGSRGSELTVTAEGFQMTVQGPRKLGSGTVHSGGSKTPGATVGTAALIATANPVGFAAGRLRR
ncbi:DUF4410 domain-containing protein [Nitrospira sp. MA-1]|nr:DUF4410 domain-containing protein [Nitrospira sp. MA-1]